MKKIDFKKLLIVPLLIMAVGPFYTSPAAAGTISDNFSTASINQNLWGVYSNDSHQRCFQQAGELRVQIDGASVYTGWFGAGVYSQFILKGNFEIVVDYRLITWPISNGVRVNVMYNGIDDSSTNYGNVNRCSFGADEPTNEKENYCTAFIDGLFLDYNGIPNTETSGKMKLIRVGSVVTGYYLNQQSLWQEIDSHDYSATGLEEWLQIGLNAVSSNASLLPNDQLVHPFAGEDVEIAFDNFQLTYDQIKYINKGRGHIPLDLLLSE